MATGQQRVNTNQQDTHFLQLHINQIIILWLRYHQCSVGLSSWQEPVQSKQQEVSSVNT